MADELEKKQSLYDTLKSYNTHHHIGFIIGPEGGITQNERAYFEKLQTKSVHLGPNILPTEYAHIYILSALSFIIHQDKL